MKNEGLWKLTRFSVDNKGRIHGSHMLRIVGKIYSEAIQTYAKGTLIDLGCGDAPYYFFYKNYTDSIICVDWQNAGKELIHLDFSADLNNNIPLDNESVDTVFCVDVIEHIKRPAILMSEISRILKPGGNLIIGVPYMYWVHDPEYDYHRYTHHMLKVFCDDNNLRVVELKPYGGLPEILYDQLFKAGFYMPPLLRKIHHFHLKLFGSILSKTTIIKKFSAITQWDFPLGYILVAQK